MELWSLLNFLYPKIFISSNPFAEAFHLDPNTNTNTNNTATTTINKSTIDRKRLLQANQLLNIFMLRRVKNQVEKLMPKKVETKVLCPLSNTQVFWYKSLLLKDINLLARASTTTDTEQETGTVVSSSSGGGCGGTGKFLSNLVMQLRKCCLHPYLFDGAEVDIDATSLEDLIAASGKLAVLDKLLRSLYAKKHRVVLFSQFTAILDILVSQC